MEKIYIETLGCSKNQIDSEKISYLLQENGYELTDEATSASYIIVNTCGFIQKAKEEAIEVILEFSKLKKDGCCKKLIVAGCLAQKYTKILIDEIPEVDLVFGIGDLSQIVNAIKSEEKVVIPEIGKDNLIKRNIIGFPGSAYLRVSDGCSNFCSYCAIPLIRGSIRSREIRDILKELEFLKTKNLKELILIAQDTSNYGIDIYNEKQLYKLIIEIDKSMDENQWLRVLYMHPDHIDDKLLESFAISKHFIPYFDIPFQSGSNRILELMGRNGNTVNYLKLVEKIRNFFPDAVFRSSFIAGFPSEKEEDFQDTLNFIKEAKIDWASGFVYSQEDGTKACDMKDQIKEKVKEKRLNKLLDFTEQITNERLKRFIGTTQKILIEEKVEDGLYIGRFWGQAPEVDGLTVIDIEEAKEGTFVEAEIKKMTGKDLFAVGL